MRERPKFLDDLAGVAGGAFSALAGARDELEALIRTRLDEAIRRFDLVRRDDLDAAMELAANARAGQEAAEARLTALEARVAVLEAAQARHAGLEEVGPRPMSTPAEPAPPGWSGVTPTEIPPPMDV